MNNLLIVHDREDELKSQFLKSLRDRIIPSAFSYWGKDESKGWISVCESKEYGVYQRGYEFLGKYIPTIFDYEEEDEKYNFISLGIGNGLKDSLVIKHLLYKDSSLQYFPIDISLDMMKSGLKNIHHDLEANCFISNFTHFKEITDTIRIDSPNRRNIVAMLGNTLGNFGQVEILNLLRSGMEKDDILLLEVTTREESGSKIRGENLSQIIESYDNEDYKDFVFRPLKKAGIEKSEGVIEVEYGPNQFYPKLSSIEIWFRFTQDSVGRYEGEEIVFKKGERIQLYVSHKYTKDNILELLDGNGFNVLDFVKSTEDDLAVILCKRK